MVYVKSTSAKEYILQGKHIPKVNAANNKWAQISNAEWTQIKELKVVQSLIKHGDILVSNTCPTELTDPAKKAKENIAQLSSQNEALKKELEALRKEAIEELQAKQAELDKLKKELEKVPKKVKNED